MGRIEQQAALPLAADQAIFTRTEIIPRKGRERVDQLRDAVAATCRDSEGRLSALPRLNCRSRVRRLSNRIEIDLVANHPHRRGRCSDLALLMLGVGHPQYKVRLRCAQSGAPP